MVPSSPAVNRANFRAERGETIFRASTIEEEMAAFDSLPAYWRDWLRDRPQEYSAIQLTQKLKERGILPP